MERFGDAREVLVLHDRGIKIHKAWPDKAIALGITQEIHTAIRNSRCRGLARKRQRAGGNACRKHWRNKAVELDVVIRVPGVNWVVAGASCQPIRKVYRIGAVLAERVSRNSRRKWASSAGGEYPVKLP